MCCLILGVDISLKEIKDLVEKLCPNYNKDDLNSMGKSDAICEFFEVENGSRSTEYSIGGLDVVLLYNDDVFYGVIVGSIIDIIDVSCEHQGNYNACVICDDVVDLHLQTSVKLTDMGIDSKNLKLRMAKG
jgi:hypothetical protein